MHGLSENTDGLVAQPRDDAAIGMAESVGVSGSDLAVALLEQSEDCIKMLSVDGHVDFINCNGLKAMEIDHPEMLDGKLWWELWPTKSQALVEEKFRDSLGGRETNFEGECPTAKGLIKRWALNLRPLFSRNGPVVAILCTSRDVTARQK